MTPPESEFFIGKNRENPEVSPISEDFSSSETPKRGEEQIVFQAETSKPPEILPSQPEIQVEEEERLEQPLVRKQEPLRGLFKKKIIEKWRKREITKEEKEKSFAALKLWAIHGVICATGTLAIGFRFVPHLLRTRSLTSLLWKMRSDPLSVVVCGLIIPGVVKLGSILAYEKRYGVEFSMLSKLLSIPLGSAMPIEIAYTLGEGPWLVNEIKERYFQTPLARAQSAFRGIRSIFKRE